MIKPKETTRVRMVMVPSLEEDMAQVRAVDVDVASSAVLPSGLEEVVERGGGRADDSRRRGVALQAEEADFGAFQQAGVDRAVDLVAGGAPLDLHRRVFEDEGALLVRVAVVAGEVVANGGGVLAVAEAAVLVVAVGALHEAFVHLVVEGLVELGPHLAVAGVAERGLLGGQQALPLVRAVDAVAVGAGHRVVAVLVAEEVHPALVPPVAVQAALA